MAYVAPTSDDFNHARWLRREQSLGDGFDAFLPPLAEQVRRHSEKTSRRDYLGNVGNALKVILGNLYHTHLRDPNRFVIIDRSNDGYPQGGYNPIQLSVRALQDTVNFLVDNGYAEERGGNYDAFRKIGYPSRLRATEKMVLSIEDHIYSEIFHDTYTIPVIRNTLDNYSNSLVLTNLFESKPLPLIRLRGQKTETGNSYLPYEPTEDTRRMEDNLQSYNEFLLKHHWIDLLLPDNELRKLSRQPDDETDDFGNTKEERRDIDLVFRRQLYRSFNNGSFAQGGRFYGGWWQGIPRAQRRWLTINWYPTAELDYSNMQIAMLYAKQGYQLQGDAYSIHGIPIEYRSLIKTTVFKVINAEGRVQPPPADRLPPGWTWAGLVDAVRKKHAAIADYFNTGIGLELQRRDADLAEEVMLAMMKENILVLPIHDSFVVPLGQRERLRAVMMDGYRSHFRHEIEISDDATWIDHLIETTPDALEMDAEGVYSLDDFLSDHESPPGFANYRQRRTDFLRTKSESWIHEHRVFLG